MASIISKLKNKSGEAIKKIEKGQDPNKKKKVMPKKKSK